MRARPRDSRPAAAVRGPIAPAAIAVLLLAAPLALAQLPAPTPAPTPAAPAASATGAADSFYPRLVAAAMERLSHRVVYDGSYRRIDYPGGDVPDSIGVCTDLVVRAYRGVGLDLQQLVHEDMREHFGEYPALWGLARPDTNIDHRRVPNLQTFFARHGDELPVSRNAGDYHAGEIVTWMLPGNLPHIGIVAAERSSDGARPLIVHNIGAGPALDDILFRYPITGHYRYAGPH